MTDTAPTQQNRRLAIDTPLGDDKVLLLSMHGSEALGRLFDYELELVTVSDPIDPGQILANNVTIRLEMLGGSTRYFNGYISKITLISVDETKESKRMFTYRASMVPSTWFMTRKSDCRIFQDMTVPEIIAAVFQTYGESPDATQLSGTYRTWEYCVQYRETDFNFVSRLMENEGIYYYYTHVNGAHTMMLCDSASAHKPVPGYESLEFDEPDPASGHDAYIWDWTLGQEITPTQYSLNEFDPLQPKNALFQSLTVEHSHDPGTFEIYDYPGGFVDPGDGKNYATARMQEQEAQYIVGHGSSCARGLYPGAIFTLDDHPVCASEDYLITAMTYQLRNDDMGTGRKSVGELYHGEVTAIPNKYEFRTPRITPKPIVQGPQTAIVVGKSGEEIWTDQYGRVKVMFFWDRACKGDETSSCFIRVSQNWAGKKWGTMFLPRIGQEVIVDFLEGDPDRPIITGRVYNGDNTPPYDLPAMQTVSTIKSNSSTGGSGFNEIRFEDKAGSEQLFVFAQKDFQQRVQHDKLEIVTHQRHITVEDQAYYHYKANVNITSDAEVHEKIGTDYHLDVVGAMPTSIGGKFSLTVGAAVVEVFKDDHSEDCSGSYFLKAANGLVIQCDAGISLVCGGNSVVLDSSGVSITGTSSVTIAGAMTKINSGPGSSPASGSAGSADAPVDPDPATEPGTGDPGELSTVTPPSETPTTIAPTSTTVPGDTPPPTDSQTTTDPPPVSKHVEFKLLDDTEQPISGEKGVLTYPDGTTKNVTTDGSGSVKVDDPNADQVTISWADRKDHEWDYLRTEDC